MAYLFWIPVAFIAFAVGSFAVSNRQIVELSLWPFPDAFVLPLYVVVLAVLALGFLIGRAAGWVAYGSVRSERRRLARQVLVLEAETARLRAEAERPRSEARSLVA